MDEVFIRIGGKTHYLWRAVDDEGEVLDIIVQPRRDRKAALKLMQRLLKRQEYLPDAIFTDRLRSYGAALRDLSLADRHVTAVGRTTARKSRTSRRAAGNASAADFDHRGRRNGSLTPMPPSTTTSTSSAT